MPRPPIPQRQPIGDIFSGVLIQIDNATKTHSWGFLASETPSDVQYHTGEFIIRYGVRYLGKPHISIVPGMIASDYGDMMTGEMAWEFIYKKGLAFPRTDILGYRNDGVDDMIAMKYLDPAIPPQVLVYADKNATQPIIPIEALIAPLEVAKTMPPRLLEYLPRFDNLEDWKPE
jgi:hypothetical protein